MMTVRVTARLLLGVFLGGGILACHMEAAAQTATECTAGGYRVVAQRWDPVLNKAWELRQDCAHPEWPAQLVATVSHVLVLRGATVAPAAQPLLVHAGDSVRLWMQEEMVRVEMNGVAEQSARSGERVMVRIVHQNDDDGLTVQRIAGTVRGAGDVEMER